MFARKMIEPYGFRSDNDKLKEVKGNHPRAAAPGVDAVAAAGRGPGCGRCCGCHRRTGRSAASRHLRPCPAIVPCAFLVVAASK
ncbi:hypothetical protein G6F60_015180 [Rhizopus arrhizus]|nr:hypothetical protein G6F60_015180 [Rhizopus arrhizus]